MAKTKEFPLLAACDIECRVQSVKKAKSGRVGAVLLLYKDARTDMRYLDDIFGANNWQRTHELIDGKLFCNIDIWDDEKKAWIRKQDVGTESNTEKEKGQASDAFKRAGFNVGIGRELYTAPFIYVPLAENEYYAAGQGAKAAYRCMQSVKFRVANIGYNDRREINELTIVDKNGVIRYEMGKQAKAPAAITSKAPAAITSAAPRPAAQQRQEAARIDPATGGMICPVCGGSISTAEWKYSTSKYGRAMCRSCQKKA